ncbi:MAG TPA: hypothetical protein DCZ59_06765 [Bacteroidetes bacterium]|nr:hypothetical protein [Bacteroidota bacterium]
MTRALESSLLAIVIMVLHQPLAAQYVGTASVSQGRATTTQQNLYTCPKGRITNVGTVTSKDGKVWTMPAAVRFSDPTFPKSSDLNNACTGVNHATSAQAVAALSPANIVTVDPDGELITCFIFADNYFEMAINGTPVGKDNVPYTQFNSSLLQFRVKRPFTIAIHAVDWEENLGLGTELSGSPYHAGDGGVVAVFLDEKGAIIATTNGSWKAQTFYTAPIYDLTCPREDGLQRLSDKCSTADVADGSNAYALHWPLPENWMSKDLDDSQWPNASEFTNQTVGVDNKPAYTNFTDVFDNPAADARFIWSSSLILDNEILLRTVVPGTTSVRGGEEGTSLRFVPRSGSFEIQSADAEVTVDVSVLTPDGRTIQSSTKVGAVGIDVSDAPGGVYLVLARQGQHHTSWLVNIYDGECRAVNRY